MGLIGDALARVSPRQRRTLAGLLGAAALWHLLLPGFFYRHSAVLIEGPLPALLGAALALGLVGAAAPTAFQVLAGCAGALVASLASTLILGLLIFGPWDAVLGVAALLRNGLRVPFAALPEAIGSPYALYVFWMGVKTLLLWGALGFVLLVCRRHGLGPRELWAAFGDRRVMSADLRRRGRDYRRLYAAAVRAGEAPPAPPPGLTVQSGGGLDGYARLSYWALRFGIVLVGAAGLYAAIGQAAGGQLGTILLRGLFGG